MVITKMPAWCSVLESSDLFASTFNRAVERDGGGCLAVTVVLVAGVADGHGRKLPHAPVDIVEIAEEDADVANRGFDSFSCKYCEVFFLVSFLVCEC